MPTERLKRYLDERHIRYVTIKHSPAYTAQEIAGAAHVPGRMLAKSVIVKLDGNIAMAVVPACDRVNLEALARVSGADRVTLASEPEFANLFPGCEVGGMPPFGKLWQIPTYMAESMSDRETICFNGGSHDELICMSMADYKGIAEPKIVPISVPEQPRPWRGQRGWSSE